jgi:hypothetical protein
LFPGICRMFVEENFRHFAILYVQLIYLHFLFEKGDFIEKKHFRKIFKLTGEVGEWLKPAVC